MSRGITVIAFDLPGGEAPDTDYYYEGDIRDSDQLAKLLADHRPGAVVHLASLLSGSSEADPQAAWEINATASVNLMHLAKEKVDGPFVFASTVATYGTDQPRILPEDAPQWPDNVYGATKVAVERMGVWLKQSAGFDFRCLRFPMVLSPFAPPGALTAYPSHACNAAARGEAFIFPVHEDTGMSTMFLNDVTRSLVEITLAARNKLTRNAYNLHGFHFTAGQLAAYLSRARQGSRFEFSPESRINALISGWPDVIDDKAAREDWNWKPAYDFEATVDAVLSLAETQTKQT